MLFFNLNFLVLIRSDNATSLIEKKQKQRKRNEAIYDSHDFVVAQFTCVYEGNQH